MKKVNSLILLFVTIFSIFSFPTYAYEEKEQVIILFNNKVDKEMLLENEIEIIHEYNNIPAVMANGSPNSIEQLKNNPEVESVEHDLLAKDYKAQIQDWGITATNAPVAWETGLTGKGVKIAVIDSGISKHKELDIQGGISYVPNTTYYNDEYGHGTHLAGIIAANNDKNGVVGIAPEASIYAVKVLDDKGNGSLSDLISGIDWAIGNNMDIINLSLGIDYHSIILEEIVNTAYDQGILLVAAAGNSGTGDILEDTVKYPARYDSVIAVSSVNNNFERDGFSATGNTVEVCAPGVNIYSTYKKNKYRYMTGTSMAAAYVSGNLALIKEKYPNFSNTELREVLHKNVLDLGEKGKDTVFGYGLIQAPVQ